MISCAEVNDKRVQCGGKKTGYKIPEAPKYDCNALGILMPLSV